MDTTKKNLEKLNKLKELLKMLDEGITKEDFIKSFRNVIDLVLKTEKALVEKNSKAITDLENLFNDLKKNLETSTNAELSGAIKELKSIVAKILKEQEIGMNFIRDKVRKIKEGKDGKDGLSGKPGRDGRDGKDGKDGLPGKDGKPGVAGMAIFGGNKPLAIQALGVMIDKNARFLNFKGSALTSVARVGKVVEITIGGGGVGNISEEIPTDSGDHLNFTIAHTPISGTFKVFRGGTRQASIGTSPDYILTGTALVLTIALDVANGEVIFVDYSYSA